MQSERTPLSGREYTKIQEFCGVVSLIADDAEGLKKRAKAAGKTTWRDYCLMLSLGRRILNDFLATIPLNKLEQINTELKNTVVYTKVEPPRACKTMDTTGYSYVPTPALNRLMNEVMDNRCSFCDMGKTEIRHCEIRKMFDDILPHRADGGNRSECQYAGIADGTDMI